MCSEFKFRGLSIGSACVRAVLWFSAATLLTVPAIADPRLTLSVTSPPVMTVSVNQSWNVSLTLTTSASWHYDTVSVYGPPSTSAYPCPSMGGGTWTLNGSSFNPSSGIYLAPSSTNALTYTNVLSYQPNCQISFAVYDANGQNVDSNGVDINSFASTQLLAATSSLPSRLRKKGILIPETVRFGAWSNVESTTCRC
jgi:hypothetical protein